MTFSADSLNFFTVMRQLLKSGCRDEQLKCVFFVTHSLETASASGVKNR